jgi:N-acetylglucosamine-6-phosphate deacetylase
VKQYGTLLHGIHYKTGKPVELVVSGGRIVTIRETEGEDGLESLPWIAPGLVDLQINGYEGLDFNQVPLTEETVHRVTKALWKEGVTSYYPTVITNGADEFERLVRSIAEACASDSLTGRCISGIHLEGPFISPEDGARGAHASQYVTAPDWELFQRWQGAACGLIKFVTMSPEWPGSEDFIRRCTAEGVIVSIGHTSATPEQIKAAAAAGARASTHLGNGAHLQMPRHPNYIWEQLAADELYACMIADGFHLPDSVLKVFMKTKGEQAILVSDAVYLCGMKPGTYTTHIGGEVVLAESGKLHLAHNPGLLAGSAQMLLWGIEHLISRGLCDFATAWEMASIRPSKLMQAEAEEGLQPGAPADLVLLERDGGRLNVSATYKGGVLVYERERAAAGASNDG